MYTPLYIKTNNTLLSSMIKIDELISYAKKNNITSLTITDNNMYGVMDFYHKCIENSIKPIIGLNIFNIVLYAKNYNGYKNLLKLSSINSEGSINLNILSNYSEDLICIVPYESINLYESLNKIYKDIFKSYKNTCEKNKLEGNNLIYMNETLYINKEDEKYLKYLIAIKEGKPASEIIIDKQNNYILNHEEMLKLYKEDIMNNYKIDELCNVEIKFNNDLLPKYDCPNNMDSFSYLKQLCKEGLKKIFGESAPKLYIDRLKYELDIINKMGFCNYFLVVYDYVKYAKENSILVGPGRGSAAGSLVSYLLNITEVDPLKYNLLFERFLNPERVSMPDIDIDFEHEKKEEVISYCMKKYGIKKVCPIITFSTLASKQAIRDVGRSLDIDLKIIDVLSKMLDSRKTLLENYNENEKLRDYIKSDKELVELYKIASKFEGFKRQTSIHAAGVIISNEDLDEIIPLVKYSDYYISGYDMTYLEKIGLLKMDFLSLKNLTLIDDVLKNIDIDFNKIPFNDSKVYELFSKGYTTGIFQFESSGMIDFLKKLKPDNFEDLIAAIALYRPGPMDNIDTYIKRKQGKEKIDYIVPSLEKILKPTYGIIIYQEQIMQIAVTLAGYTLGEADILRKAMSKKKEDLLLSHKEKFINGCIKNGLDEKNATKVYELVLKFASYGFNRAHSVAYSMIAYKMAYLKTYYSKEFMKSLLSSVIGSEIKTKEYIYESKLLNIDILKPDINLSTNEYLIEEFGIRFPLTSIKNVGINAVNTIIEERKKGKFKDIFDFVKRTYGKSINKQTITNLTYAGCFNSFGYNKQTIIENLDIIINYGEIGALLSDESLLPEIKIFKEYDNKLLSSYELSVFGFYLSNHPITEYKIKYEDITDLINIKNYFNKSINVIVYVDRIKEIKTKKNEIMCFITGSDELLNIDMVLFPSVYENVKIDVGDIVLCKCKVEKRFDKYQLVVNEINKIG